MAASAAADMGQQACVSRWAQINLAYWQQLWSMDVSSSCGESSRLCLGKQRPRHRVA